LTVDLPKADSAVAQALGSKAAVTAAAAAILHL
jgi:hypothetical protein